MSPVDQQSNVHYPVYLDFISPKHTLNLWGRLAVISCLMLCINCLLRRCSCALFTVLRGTVRTIACPTKGKL